MNDALEESPDQVGQYTDWYGFDTENDDKGKVTLAALVHESGSQKVWHRAGHFAEWVDKQPGKPVIICHNLEYDLINEFGTKAYSEMALTYLKGRLISARHKNVKFLDSFNHFRMSLAQIGEAIGIKKMEMDIYSEEYVAQDAWICLKVMTRARDYIASLGGRIAATSGGSAVSVWKYMTDSEWCTGAVDTPWLRKSYYGGRTEIFRRATHGRPLTGSDVQVSPGGDVKRLYHHDIKGFDINSMYPFCMMEEYPEYLMEDQKLEKAKGVAEITIDIPESLYVAPLPHRDSVGRLVYPVGTVRGVWTYDEIRFAEECGAKVHKIHKALGCNLIVKPFTGFIETLYARRKASKDESERLFLKVLMNSLYGKLASKNTCTRTVSRYNLIKSKSKRLEEVKWITYQRGLLDYFTPQQDYVNVCWGSMVTAYSRILLARYLKQVPEEKLIYCDTDSVYCLDHLFPVSAELGGMKLEKEAGEMLVVQPKAYQLDEFYKAKGVPKAKKDKDGKILIDYARQYIEEGFTEFQAPIRFKASINSKRGVANQWVGHKKTNKTPYQAKILSGDRYFPPVIREQMELMLTSPIVTKTVSSGKARTKR